jgi:hypothetical protein
MEIVLNLSKTELGLLRALCPPNARRDSDLASTAKALLIPTMRKEAQARRIDDGRIFALAIDESLQRRKEGIR